MGKQLCTWLALLIGVVALLSCQGGNATAPAATAVPPTVSPTPGNAAYLDMFETVWGTIDERYFDPTFGGVDWPAVHDRYRPLIAAAQDNHEFYQLINQMVRELRVSHVFVIPPAALAYLQSTDTCAGSAGLDVRPVDGQIVVTAVKPGYPAEAAGLRPGDVILTVEGLPVERADELMLLDLPAASEEERLAAAFATARDLFYGEPGTTVTITYLDAQDQVHEAQLLRQQRTERLAESSEGLPPFYVEVETRQLEGGIGYIDFSAFHTGVLQEVLDAIDALQGAPGLILDLRGNPGGFYPVRKGIAEKFFQERTLFWRYETRPGLDLPGFEHEAYLEPAAPVYTGTLVILVDEFSASSAEEFSGAMQATGRAAIVGQRTAGKVLVADIVQLPNGALFMYPLARTVLSDGTVLEGHGVIPDVEVPLDRDQIGQGIDAPLEAAVAYIKAQSGQMSP